MVSDLTVTEDDKDEVKLACLADGFLAGKFPSESKQRRHCTGSMKLNLRETSSIHAHHVLYPALFRSENVSIDCEAVGNSVSKRWQLCSIAKEWHETISVVVIEELEGFP